MDFRELYLEAVKRDCQQARILPTLAKLYAPTTGEDWQAVLRIADAAMAASEAFWSGVMHAAARLDMAVEEDHDFFCPCCEQHHCINARPYRLVATQEG